MNKLYGLFLFMCVTCFAGIVLSITGVAGLKVSDGATLFAGLLATGIIWWQGHLIKQQMQLQAIIELDKEWNSREMLEKRRGAWNDRNETDESRIEDVLEFLEKVSTFEKNGVISEDLIWDTFGWYVWRYYQYNNEVIRELRKEWTPKEVDLTLYQDLEALCGKLLNREIEERNKKKSRGHPILTEQDVRQELDITREKFIASERALIHD